MREVYLEDLWAERLEDEGRDMGITVTKFPFVIGRHPDCDYRIHHPSVSRQHCSLSLEADTVWVQDLGSRNGTYLNGVRIQEPQPLHQGDMLCLSHLPFKVRLPPLPLVTGRRWSPGKKLIKTPDQQHHILVVDDNADAAEALALLLAEYGHDVQVAHDGQEAIHAVHTHHPDTVVMDIRLPGMNGYQVARQLRADPDLERTRLVAITGYEQEGDARRSREVGFYHLLTKPVDPEVLLHVIDHPV